MTTTPRSKLNESVSLADRRAAIPAIAPSEAGGRGDLGGISSIATGSR